MGCVRARAMVMTMVLLCGCGPSSYVVLEIDAESDVRGSVNKLYVLIYSARNVTEANLEAAVPLSNMWVSLEPPLDFPVTYGTQPTDSTPERLAAVVEGWMFTEGVGDAHVASTPLKDFSWQENDVTRVKMPRLALLP